MRRKEHGLDGKVMSSQEKTAGSRARDDSGQSGWVVHKFGGSSVADAECIARVADIIESTPVPRVAVVLSACKGVTDGLLQLVTLAEQRDPLACEKLQALGGGQFQLDQHDVGVQFADRADGFGEAIGGTQEVKFVRAR